MYYDRKRKKYRAQVYFVDSDGKRHRKYLDCSTKREALLKEEEYKLKRGSLPAEEATFQAVLDDYLERSKTCLRASSLAHYARIARLHLTPTFGEKKISKITFKDIDDWKNDLTSAGYSLQYRKHCYKVLKLVFRHAFAFYSLSNPAIERSKNFRPDPNAQTKKKEIQYWTPEEFSLWLKSVEEAQEKEPDNIVLEATKVLVSIGYYAGLRKGEINALRVSDYKDRDGSKYLSVTKSIAQNLTGYGTITTNPKTSSSVREVFVDRFLAKILDGHIEFLKRIGYLDPDPYLVYGVGPLPNTTLEVTKEKFEKIAGIRHIRVHDLRHSFVSNLINAGVPIEMISKVCGHASTEVTFHTYGHLFPSSQEEMANRLDSYLSKSIEKLPPK